VDGENVTCAISRFGSVASRLVEQYGQCVAPQKYNFLAHPGQLCTTFVFITVSSKKYSKKSLHPSMKLRGLLHPLFANNKLGQRPLYGLLAAAPGYAMF
jgi:hypothetical protein